MKEIESLTMDSAEFDKLIFWRSADCISTIIEDETVILDVKTGVYSGLNEVGTLVWNLLKKDITFAEMRESILAEFEVTAEECSENLLSFLKELVNNNLIEVKVETNK